MMRNIQSLGNRLSISLPSDERGFVGRECPASSCNSYFKVKPGTGLKGRPCRCPHCGHAGASDTFTTKEQIAYAKSMVMRQVGQAISRDMHDMLRPLTRSNGLLRITVTETHRPRPIRYYREKELETELTCDACGLEYAIYGVFAFCPDCGAHNSRQILEKNLTLVGKELALSETIEGALAEHLVGDALENAVSAFDGFGRELCRVAAFRLPAPAAGGSVSFQNLAGAQKNLARIFSFDLAAAVTPAEWTTACCGFQKRHVLAHAMGVVDDAYLTATGDHSATKGRKIRIEREEVRTLVDIVRKLALATEAALLPASP